MICAVIVIWRWIWLRWHGDGVEADRADALKWYRRAAEQGFADLGRARFSGRRRARCWTASGKVLDGVKEGAGRRPAKCQTASRRVLDAV